jgi:hypothetical protein
MKIITQEMILGDDSSISAKSKIAYIGVTMGETAGL